MVEGASSLTMSVPNIITSSPSGGRFDFDDGGTYCGGWQDGKAHGHGVCTGPKNVGEYSGSWNFGFEMSGVYKWTNGAVYEGRWQNGKRHGVGVEYNGKWIYKGEWSQGLKGRYGVKASSNSAVKYEGTWANGLQDGYGSETYSDGGYYQGQMCRGLRHGYGVRKSAPYGDSQLNNPSKNGPISGGPPGSMLIHSNSMQSSGSAVDLSVVGLGGGGAAQGGGDDDSPKPEDGFKPNIDRTLVSKNGFVLVSKPLDVPMPNPRSFPADGASSKRRSSLTNKLASSARIPNSTTATLLRGLRLKKQKSTSDLDALGGLGGARSKASGGLSGSGGGGGHGQLDGELPMVPFTLSPEELDITDPTTVETYTGEWKHDKRNGHGVCDRSDGLRYEGQWHNDMKCGYGVTTFKDGSKEEGKYKNNILIADSKVKRFFQLGGSNIRQRIDDSVKMAQQAQTMALKKAEIADTRAATARDKADQAMTAAIEADRDSQIAYSVARQYSDSQQQQQQQLAAAAAAAANFNSPMFGASNFADHQPSHLQQNLNMATSPLQMRRISQHQQRNFYQNQPNNFQPHQQAANAATAFDQHQQRQQAQATGGGGGGGQQYLGPVEPFNGRRGSFRGGSSQPSSSGYHSAGGARLPQHQHQHQLLHQQLAGQAFNPSLASRQSADPFNDLFDHYKSSATANNGYPGLRSRRSLMAKQTSLDQNQMRQTSVPRQLGSGLGSERFRRFRMSSLDHADENQLARGRTSQSSISQQQEVLMQQQQQQFRHLVTSGEELQQQQQQLLIQNQHIELHQLQQQQQQQQLMGTDQELGGASMGAAPHQHQGLNAPTPTGSSYILPHSSGAGSTSTAGNYNASNLSASPSDRAHSQQGQLQQQQQQQQQQPPPSGASQPPAAPYYGQPAGQQANYVQHVMMQNYQRDVHSLADEQLYLSRRRNVAHDELDKSDYSNYDFTISSGPRPVARCMRRTASLSRATLPMNGSHLSLAQQQQQQHPRLQLDLTPTSGSHGALASSAATLSATRFQLQQQQQHGAAVAASDLQPLAGGTDRPMGGAAGPNRLAIGPAASQHHLSPNSCDSSLSSTSPLSRKPSLQVRYDPIQLGSLMSREEVAALSHEQRERKRLEAELAEKRASQPLLHLLLTLKEFLARHQLIISVLFINVCLLKMFADLIV